MNNLHRELAPISSSACRANPEEEVARSNGRWPAAASSMSTAPRPRLSAVGTGHLVDVAAPRELVNARLREVRTIVELTVPFELSRDAIDSVERGARDADGNRRRRRAAARVRRGRRDFRRLPGRRHSRHREGTSNRKLTLPADVSAYPDAISDALEALRLAGVDGPYSVVLGSDAYTALSEARDQGYPVLGHIKRIVSGEIIWAPAISGGCVLSTRGGDYELHLGKTYRSATRAIPTRSSACTCAKRSRS